MSEFLKAEPSWLYRAPACLALRKPSNYYLTKLFPLCTATPQVKLLHGRHNVGKNQKTKKKKKKHLFRL
jgi:hypothetical protein